MKEIKTSKGTLLFVEVPKDAHTIKIYSSTLEGEKNTGCYIFLRALPIGNYQFLCTTDTITEDIAKMIFNHKTHPLFRARIVFERIKTKNLTHWSFSIKECIDTLLESNNLDTDKNYAICKKVN